MGALFVRFLVNVDNVTLKWEKSPKVLGKMKGSEEEKVTRIEYASRTSETVEEHRDPYDWKKTEIVRDFVIRYYKGEPIV